MIATDVAELSGVGPVLEARLAAAGITTVEDLVLAEPLTLLEVPGIGRKRGGALLIAARAALGDNIVPLPASIVAAPATSEPPSQSLPAAESRGDRSRGYGKKVKKKRKKSKGPGKPKSGKQKKKAKKPKKPKKRG